MTSEQSDPASDAATADKSIWARRFGDLDRYDVVIVGVLCLLYLTIQIGWFLRTIPFSDQIHYFSVAAGVEETTVNHRDLRIGLTLPVRLMIEVFGYTQVAYYVVPLAAALLFLTATYLFGALLHSRAAGAMGAAAAVFNSYVISDSSYLLPDLLGVGLLTLALVMIGGSRGRRDSGWSPDLVGAGLVLGWSYLVREFLVVLFPLALLVAWSAGRAKARSIVQVAEGALAMLGVELLHGTIVLGDPFARVQALLHKAPGTGGGAAQGSEGAPGFAQQLGEAALILPQHLLDRRGSWLLLGLAALALIGFVTAAVSRETTAFRRLLVPVTWMLGVYVLMTLFGPPVLRLTLFRYWYPIIPPLAVGGAMALLLPFDSGWLVRLTGPRGATWARRAVTALMVVVALGPYALLGSANLSDSFVSSGGGSEYREFRAWLTAEGDSIDRLNVDIGHWRALGLVLPMYTRTPLGHSIWDGELRLISVDDPPPPSDIEGPIVAHTESTERMVHRMGLPQYLAEPPTGWRPIMVSSNGKLAVLATRPADAGASSRLTIDGGVPAQPATDDLTRSGNDTWAVDMDAGTPVELSYAVAAGAAGADQPSTISIVLHDDLTGDGWVQVHCEFDVDGAERAFAVTPEPDDAAATNYYCDGTGLTRIRVALHGPLHGAIESVTASLWRSATPE